MQTVKTDQPGHITRMFALGAHAVLLTHFILNDLKWSENAIRSALNLSIATIYVRHANTTPNAVITKYRKVDIFLKMQTNPQKKLIGSIHMELSNMRHVC